MSDSEVEVRSLIRNGINFVVSKFCGIVGIEDAKDVADTDRVQHS
jgi:hypothetical protein